VGHWLLQSVQAWQPHAASVKRVHRHVSQHLYNARRLRPILKLVSAEIKDGYHDHRTAIVMVGSQFVCL
jgi:hypothetical protein